eukprot:5631843-Amphidinium_carterae.3
MIHEESLEKQETRLVANDASFVIELGFVRQMSGELGKRTLQDMCFKSFPTAEVSISPEDCYKRIVEITKSDLWLFVDKTAHGEVEKAKKWVQSLADGFAASHHGLLETKRQKGKTSGDADVMIDVPVFGADALGIIYKSVKKKGDKAGSDDLKPLVSMSHLLSDATKRPRMRLMMHLHSCG